MSQNDKVSQIDELIKTSERLVIIQADNPDADSLASSLALEAILEEQGKEITLYCGVDMPSYLHYMQGWSRVVRELPFQFDAAIIVDTSSDTLLEQLNKGTTKTWLTSRPVIILDHHSTESTINFAKVIYNPPAAATAEVIYELATKLDWKMDSETKKLLAIAILSDSLGLMSQSTSPRTIHIIAELVEGGVSLPEIERARRDSLRREPELVHYKGELLKRVEFHDNGRVALLSIPWAEIEKYSPLYNPPMLVLDDMRLAKQTELAICFKLYSDGRITAKLRANYGFPVAAKLAEHFGGGGHPLASGFKITNGRAYDELKRETIELASKLLDEVEQSEE